MAARVLIAGPSFSTAKALETKLAPVGVEACLATRPEDALALAQNDEVSVGILDLTVSGSEGADLCRRLRAEHPDLALLALTLDPVPLQRLRALDGGADEVACPDLDPGTLALRIRGLAILSGLRADARRMAALRGLPLPAVDGSGGRVLVLDPDQRSRTRLAELLSPTFAVTALADPARGVMQAAEGAFDLAWVSHEWADGSDGLKIARHLRLVDPSAALRVLLVAEAGECRARALEEAGADDLVLRPVDRCEAMARSRVALEKSRLRSAFREALPSAVLPLPSRLSQPVRRRPPDRFAA